MVVIINILTNKQSEDEHKEEMPHNESSVHAQLLSVSTLCDPIWDYRTSGSPVHGIFKQVLGGFSSTPGSLPNLGVKPHISGISCIGKWILCRLTSWEAQ